MHSQFSFESNGEIRSSDEFGVIAVYFENNSSQGFHAGQETELKTEKSGKGINWNIISQDYSRPMEFTLQIINKDDSPFSQEQEMALNKALCHRGEYGWFFIQEPQYADIWFKCNIHSPQVWNINDRNGLQYTVTTNSSIVYSGEREHTFEMNQTDGDDVYVLHLNSDEEIAVYPIIEIEMLEDGDLTISNSADTDINHEYIFKLNGLISGELVTIDNDYPRITSEYTSHDNIFNDCNLKWLRLYDGENRLTFNKKCNVKLKYREYKRLIVF